MAQKSKLGWGSFEQSEWAESPHWGEVHPRDLIDNLEYSGFSIVETVRRRIKDASPQPSAELLSALQCLDDIESDASAMGYDAPSDAVVAEAKRILRQMHDYRALPYDAYSMADGRVAIGVDGGFVRSMLVVCEPAGKALCVVTINRISRRARYGDSSFLPDDFVKQGLRQLRPARQPKAAKTLQRSNEPA